MCGEINWRCVTATCTELMRLPQHTLKQLEKGKRAFTLCFYMFYIREAPPHTPHTNTQTSTHTQREKKTMRIMSIHQSHFAADLHSAVCTKERKGGYDYASTLLSSMVGCCLSSFFYPPCRTSALQPEQKCEARALPCQTTESPQIRQQRKGAPWRQKKLSQKQPSIIVIWRSAQI